MDDASGGQAADHDAQWGHDWERYGRLRASDDEWLAPVAALVALYAVGSLALPMREATGRVIAALRTHAGVPLFVTHPGRWAVRIRDDWPEWRPAKAGRRGKPGTLAVVGRAPLVTGLGSAWSKAESVSHLYLYELMPGVSVVRLAIRVDDAAELFPALFEVEAGTVEAAPQGQPSRQVIQPEGGQWPHVDGTAWTDAERAALFEMRHRCKREDAELLQLITLPARKPYTRKHLHDLIGPKQIKHDSFDGKAWEPSDELLKRCGMQRPASPLPTLAVVNAARA